MRSTARAGAITAPLLLLSLLATSCSSSSSSSSGSASSSLCPATSKRCIAFGASATESDVSSAFASTQQGDTLAFGPGTYKFKKELTLGSASDVTVVGAGQGQTILDFGGQVAGGENGLYAANTSNIVFEGFTVQNTPGNGIKTMAVKGATFRNLEVTWVGLKEPGNGAAAAKWTATNGDAAAPAGLSDGPYGLYPVQSSDVLIEHCAISGASDSGIYVGQSKDIVVRNNEAFANVAGIEIENSSNADVHDNYAHDNTAGILVFALPDLMIKTCSNVRVYDNEISGNDRPNFAAQGDIVGLVPAGTGFFAMAADHVEVFGNRIQGNGTGGAGVISYYLPNTVMPTKDTTYGQYPSYVYVHDNVYIGNGTAPDTTGPTSGTLGSLIAAGIAGYPQMRMPDISYDGVADDMAMAAAGTNPQHICFHEASTATFCDGHWDQQFKATCDVTPYACTLPALPAVSFPGLTP
jgi:parallel beta-helix repeat protein